MMFKAREVSKSMLFIIIEEFFRARIDALSLPIGRQRINNLQSLNNNSQYQNSLFLGPERTKTA